MLRFARLNPWLTTGKRRACALLCCLALQVHAGASHAATLRAGVAKVDITPPAGLALWGYAERVAPATGALDPLFARVLVLEAGQKRLAWIVLDLGRPFGPNEMQQISQAAHKSSGITNLLVQATHTHSAPAVLDSSSAPLPSWQKAALEKIENAIAEAARRLTDVRIGTGYGQANIGYNRRWINPDGTVSMMWRNLTHIPTSPVDPTVAVLRIDAADGKPIAILANYACHPVVLGQNLQYSADFPGIMTKLVEEAFGGTAICFFIQGAPGDINPYARAVADDGPHQLESAGRGLGDKVVKIAQAIGSEVERNASIDVAEDVLSFQLRWNPEKYRKGLLSQFGSMVLNNTAARGATVFQLAVTTVLINKRIAMMTMPGEPFVTFQMNWRDRCPAPNAFFLGYTNGYFGYFPTIPEAAQGGYGASDASTRVEVGAGERMVDHAVTRIYQMLGRLTDAPVEPVAK